MKKEVIVTYTYNKDTAEGLKVEQSRVVIAKKELREFVKKLLKWEPQNTDKIRIEEKYD